MTLKAVVESLDDVDEAFRGEYVEKEIPVQGRSGETKKVYVLDTDVRVHPDTQALRSSLESERKEHKATKSKLAEANTRLEGLPDDFSIDSYNQSLAELEELKKGGGRPDEAAQAALKKTFEDRLTAAEKKRQDDLAAKDEEIAKRDKALERRVRNEDLVKALTEVGVEKELFEAAHALHLGRVQMRQTEDGDYETFVDSDLGEVSVKEYVDSWAKSEAGKRFVPRPAGGGAAGAGGGRATDVGPNPWKKESINRMEQAKILKTDRVKAARMMKAAGMTDSEVTRLTSAA